MNKLLILVLSLAGLFSTSCSGIADITIKGDYVVKIEPGDEWLHQFSRFIKTPPQYALWMEDESGSYLGTVFLTRKTATEGWAFNKGNRRIEALPVWAHKRNVRDEEGVLYPSREEPLTDGISGATPKGDSEVVISPIQPSSGFRIFLEINQSTDFNESWPESAVKGLSNWTGGAEGSGQPSLIYSAWVNPDEQGPWTLTLIGHGSPDGSTGQIYEELGTFSTALHILQSAEVSVIP